MISAHKNLFCSLWNAIFLELWLEELTHVPAPRVYDTEPLW